MIAAETAVCVLGGGEFWAPGSTVGLRMAEAFWEAGCEVLYFECGGDGKLFRLKTARLKMNAPDVFVHPDRERFYVARAERLPGMRLAFPGPVRRWHAGRVSRKLRDFFSWPSRADSRVLIAHYGWYFPEAGSGRDWRERRLYECIDDHAAALNIRDSGWKRRYVLGVERHLLARADLTVFMDPELLEKRRGDARRVEHIPQGVDHEHFAARPDQDPHEARGIGRPRVGFVGNVTKREDWVMVAAAAELRPDWQWVVAGPAEGVKPQGPANLHWLGQVPYAEVPGWLHGWDAAFVPLADSQFNRASQPLKFYECLAAGLPLASTPIPAAAKLEGQTRGLVVPAAGWGAPELAAALDRARGLRERARTEGPAFAARHSWKGRAERILEMIPE
ncbi:MAG TPA: glycosyltransferase [Planctomycetota bacterium]|nr:glycosyltransferase [Planctomycetota bacterium]